MKLSDLAIGDHARFLSYDPQYTERERLLAMGLTPGVRISVREVAPLGDSFVILLRGAVLALPKSVCLALEVERLSS